MESFLSHDSKLFPFKDDPFEKRRKRNKHRASISWYTKAFDLLVMILVFFLFFCFTYRFPSAAVCKLNANLRERERERVSSCYLKNNISDAVFRSINFLSNLTIQTTINQHRVVEQIMPLITCVSA